MIIDCYGHFTTVPGYFRDDRKAQIADFVAGKTSGFSPAPVIPEDELREGLEADQMRLQTERGIDLTLFSPIAGPMGHHHGDEALSQHWSATCNASSPAWPSFIPRVSPRSARCRSRLAPIRVSGWCHANFHGTDAHYLNSDTTVFMQLLLSDLFKDFPTLRMVIPHGGGAVRSIDPETGVLLDETKHDGDALDLTPEDRHAIFDGNLRRVYPRLDARL